jgi:hypothetical protein
MRALWTKVGLDEVADTAFMVRMEYLCFDDFWSPLAGSGTQRFFRVIATPCSAMLWNTVSSAGSWVIART